MMYVVDDGIKVRLWPERPKSFAEIIF